MTTHWKDSGSGGQNGPIAVGSGDSHSRILRNNVEEVEESAAAGNGAAGGGGVPAEEERNYGADYGEHDDGVVYNDSIDGVGGAGSYNVTRPEDQGGLEQYDDEYDDDYTHDDEYTHDDDAQRYYDERYEEDNRRVELREGDAQEDIEDDREEDYQGQQDKRDKKQEDETFPNEEQRASYSQTSSLHNSRSEEVRHTSPEVAESFAAHQAADMYGVRFHEQKVAGGGRDTPSNYIYGDTITPEKEQKTDTTGRTSPYADSLVFPVNMGVDIKGGIPEKFNMYDSADLVREKRGRFEGICVNLCMCNSKKLIASSAFMAIVALSVGLALGLTKSDPITKPSPITDTKNITGIDVSANGTTMPSFVDPPTTIMPTASIHITIMPIAAPPMPTSRPSLVPTVITTRLTPEPTFDSPCKLCAGRGGDILIDQDLSFIPFINETSDILDFMTCGKLFDNLPQVISLFESEFFDTEACPVFQMLGVYCGCNTAAEATADTNSSGEQIEFDVGVTNLEEGLRIESL